MAENKPEQAERYASHGVEMLIQKLREQGVDQGRVEAQDIVDQAKKQAARIIVDARNQADEIVSSARTEADSLKTAGRDALELAARDAHLKLRETVNDRFSDEVRRLVGEIMKPEEFLAKLILEVAGRARAEAGLDDRDSLLIKLPEEVVAIEDLRRNPEELKEGTLSHVVVSLMASLLKKGISFESSSDISGGIKASLKDGDIELDLSDEAITAVLMEHLQPRFRALLEGVVR